ncbi:response regulator [candidate division KSB1 bacterium]|nr:MAG: response regulator [candidate division KSB1 bacterium]
MSKKILLIDDDSDFVNANKLLLEKNGFEVVTAFDGEEGLKKAEVENPDLIVLDVMMKTGTEGFHVAKQIREIESLKETPVIMLSGIRRDLDMKWDFEPDERFLPVTEFLEKPLSPQNLLEKIRQLIG